VVPKVLRLVALFTAVVVGIGACGFKLRGAVEVPPELNPMYLEGPANSPVRGAIVQRLELSEVRIAATQDEARVILRILGEARSSRVAAVDRDGKVLARELHLAVTFDLVNPDGSERIGTQTLDLVRTYEDPGVEVLGRQLEAELIYEDLVQDAAERILARLRATLR
jgi:LPS-assembly lipoprotein